MKKSGILQLLLVGLVAGCTQDAPNAPTGGQHLAANLTGVGSSGCHTVSGEIHQTGRAPSFSGTISGDIVGDVSTQLDPASAHSAGRVRFTSGEQTWEVSGGNVPGLIGRTVRLALETEIVFAQPPVGRNNTSARVVEGAEAGALTYHGTFDASPPPPFSALVEYRGVICP